MTRFPVSPTLAPLAVIWSHHLMHIVWTCETKFSQIVQYKAAQLVFERVELLVGKIVFPTTRRILLFLESSRHIVAHLRSQTRSSDKERGKSQSNPTICPSARDFQTFKFAWNFCPLRLMNKLTFAWNRLSIYSTRDIAQLLTNHPDISRNRMLNSEQLQLSLGPCCPRSMIILSKETTSNTEKGTWSVSFGSSKTFLPRRHFPVSNGIDHGSASTVIVLTVREVYRYALIWLKNFPRLYKMHS